MKKLLLLIVAVCSITASAQTEYYDVVTGVAPGTSQNGRAPQGARAAGRSVWIITAAEMSAAGFVAGDVVTGLGFNYSVAQDVTTDGTFDVYMENTGDATNTKSTDWATAITGMTLASSGAITVPNVAGTFDVPFIGGSTFTYTGNGVYVAFDYQNLLNPVSGTPNTAMCDTSITGGLKGAMSAAGSTTPPTTLGVSNYRPLTRLGKVAACPRPTAVTEVLASKTQTSATFTWTSSSATNLEYGPYGFPVGTETVINNVTSPYTLTGLTPGTVYDIYFQNDCGASGLSNNSNVYSFNTAFPPVAAPYNTSFEEYENVPFIGWATGVVPPGANDWQIQNFGPGALVQDGNSSVYSITPNLTAGDNWLLSRGVDLTLGYQATITYYLSNYVQAGSTGTTSYNLTVGTAQTIAAQTTNLAAETGISDPTYTLKTFTYTPPATGTYYFGLQNISPANATGLHAVFVDNFTVSESLLGVNDFISNKFSISPNPATDVIRVTNSENMSVTGIAVTDLNGRVVKQLSYNDASNIKVNVSDLASGMYLMKITSDKGVALKKVIKN